MDTPINYKQHFDQLQSAAGEDGLSHIREKAFADFGRLGIPTVKHEEWKYTRIGSLFNKTLKFAGAEAARQIIDSREYELPESSQANELFFINGVFSFERSVIRSKDLLVQPLGEAMKGEYAEIIGENLGHSDAYLRDGIHALNAAMLNGAVFISVPKGTKVEHPVYIYHLNDGQTLALPRSLVYIGARANITLVETHSSLVVGESFTNQVMEVVMERDAMVEYYKIEDDVQTASLVSTTHFRQRGRSHLHAVTISLNGAIVRNNMNVVFDDEHGEAHLYGLYFPVGKTHIDNHTIVDNAKPHCFSNEFYKGVLGDQGSGVFNGKIYVRQDAQKTNAYQSNKNILLSESASVNTKPQLEIFADDVKCSHGCTVGQLDETALFYLRSRGVSEDMARALLVHSFAADVLEHIKPTPIKKFIEERIAQRLQFDAV